ncbi:DUF2867 domain-containing protein [Bordetella muralis]|uniref:DUF2867 domain-containing protein n=1 Tax=Bordetella muralis TaxID=1649130 RepID=UPI0039F0623F
MNIDFHSDENHQKMKEYFLSVCRSDIPISSNIRSHYKKTDLRDAYSVLLPNSATDDPERLARHLHENPAPWFHTLLRIRDLLVAPLGIKTSRQFERDAKQQKRDHISFFLIFSCYRHEIVYGLDDVHLDFRASVLVVPPSADSPCRKLVAVTVVKCHNSLGRLYIRLIAPFHKLAVIGGLRQAAKIGWPAI